MIDHTVFEDMMMMVIIIPLLSFHVPCVIYARYFTPLGFSRPFFKENIRGSSSGQVSKRDKADLMDLHSKFGQFHLRNFLNILVSSN